MTIAWRDSILSSMLTEIQRKQLIAGGAEWGVALDAEMVQKLDRFAEMLEQANRQFNLTRISPEEVVSRQFLDSLALAAVIRIQGGEHLIDVGTGAGFPGLPLALAFPELTVTLLDGTKKRLNFLDGVIADLGLRNARTLHGRAEEIARQPLHRAHYDLATARAVAKLPELAAWMLPLVRSGGQAIAYKSRDVEAEVKEARPVIERLGARLKSVTEIALPGTDVVRKLVVMYKLSSTPTGEGVRKDRGRPERR